jgi:M6 family metalloprotease-like protein
MAVTRVASGLNGAIGSAQIPNQDLIAFVEWTGQLLVWDAAAQVVKKIGADWLQPESIVVADDGSTAYVTERGGEVLKVDLGMADRANAQMLVSGLDEPHQLALSADRTALFVVEFGASGRLLRIDLGTNEIKEIAGGLERAIGLVLSPDGTAAYVTEQAASGGRLTKIDIETGIIIVLLNGLIAPFFLTWADGLPDGQGNPLSAGTHLLLAERDPANRISVVNLGMPTISRRTIDMVGFRPSSVAGLGGNRLYAFSDREISELDVSTGLEPSVKLQMPTDSLFIGGWAKVAVEVSGAGLTFDDLDFVVEGAPIAGGISPSRDATFDPARPDIMLLAGSEPGQFALSVIELTTGVVLAKEAFEVKSEWADERRGAPVQFIGESRLFTTGAAWGGGATGPQNVDVFPASGTRRVAIVMVDTTSTRYPTDAPTLNGIRTEWQTELLGVTDPDGVVRGVRQYFREASYGRYDISLVGGQVFGPFQLPSTFTDYYEFDKDRSVWRPRGNLWQACVTAAQGQVDFDQVDTLVCVMRTVPATATTAAQFSWPWANGGTFTYRRPGASSNSSRSIPCLTMPDDWEARDGGGRRTHETLAHEIGHNLGLGDLYMNNLPGFDAQIQQRDVGGWDLMSNENPLPQLSLPHRMMLGWVRPAWIRSFDFRSSGGVDVTLTLQATELLGMGGPPAGRLAGIEVRRADGWNYYFEYRAGQVTQISDRDLPSNRRVLGTDVVSPTFTVPQNRRLIILLPNDPDGDGPVLNTGADYEETDTSGPANFQLDVVSTAADSAQIRVRYGTGGRPDPSIRPWPGGNNWQSPDIEITNARSATRGEWRNTPWAGQMNTITAKITNRGTFIATNVQANFYVKNLAVGDAPEFFIGRDIKTITPGATVDFSTLWTPPANTPDNGAHYCVIVRIPLYQDPGNPAIVELTELNNVAQSNYTRFISSTASPAKRMITSVVVNNPYPEPTRVFVVPQQSSDWYRTYLEHAWLWLNPGESRSVAVMVESLLGDPAFPELQKLGSNFYERPHDLSLIGLIENSQDPHLHTADIMGGANVRVLTGRATRIDLDEFNEIVVRGRVITVDDRQPVTFGEVIISLKPKGIVEEAEYRTGQGKIRQDGSFLIEVAATNLLAEAGVVEGQAHFLGAFGLADTDSKVVRLKR